VAPAPPPSELRSLTGARGIAAWLVVLFHLRFAAGSQVPDWLHALLAKGYLAVDFFFVLSGFVLWLNYQQKFRDGGLALAPRFICRRIARISPLHAVMLAGAALFALALTLRGTPDDAQFPWLELPLHLLLVQNWGFTDSLTWNDPAWSISCELGAYLLFPLLVLAVDWRRFPPSVLLVILVASGVALALALQALGGLTMNTDIPRLGLLRAVGEFAMGTMVAAIWCDWRERSIRSLAPAIAALLALAAVTLGLAGEIMAVAILWPLALLTLALADPSRFNPLHWAPVHYLGRISYSTYLVHYLLFIAFKLLLHTAVDIPLVALGGFLLLTFAASMILHHGVELPGQRLLNRFFDHWLERAGAARKPLSPA
jgi:peptidoglycan/LPS O-acetylase OafA/YrhL